MLLRWCQFVVAPRQSHQHTKMRRLHVHQYFCGNPKKQREDTYKEEDISMLMRYNSSRTYKNSHFVMSIKKPYITLSRKGKCILTISLYKPTKFESHITLLIILFSFLLLVVAYLNPNGSHLWNCYLYTYYFPDKQCILIEIVVWKIDVVSWHIVS